MQNDCIILKSSYDEDNNYEINNDIRNQINTV